MILCSATSGEMPRLTFETPVQRTEQARLAKSPAGLACECATFVLTVRQVRSRDGKCATFSISPQANKRQTGMAGVIDPAVRSDAAFGARASFDRRSPFAAFVADDPESGAACAPRSTRPIASPETECLPALLRARRRCPPRPRRKAQALARRLVEGLRARPAAGLVQGLMHEYALSSQEGVALMCLAEALLRIPDERHARRADRRQDRRRRMARSYRPVAVAVRQRGDLGPARHRAAGWHLR